MGGRGSKKVISATACLKNSEGTALFCSGLILREEKKIKGSLKDCNYGTSHDKDQNYTHMISADWGGSKLPR